MKSKKIKKSYPQFLCKFVNYKLLHTKIFLYKSYPQFNIFIKNNAKKYQKNYINLIVIHSFYVKLITVVLILNLFFKTLKNKKKFLKLKSLKFSNINVFNDT